MIDFGNKRCAALMDRLSKLVWIEDGIWQCADETAAQAIIDTYTLADAIDARRAEVDVLAKLKFDNVSGNYSPGEMAGWPILNAEAVAYGQSGNAKDCPSIAFEAGIRGVTVAQLIERVLENAAAFSALRGAIAGVAGAHRDALLTLQSFDAVDRYDISSGWPV